MTERGMLDCQGRQRLWCLSTPTPAWRTYESSITNALTHIGDFREPENTSGQLVMCCIYPPPWSRRSYKAGEPSGSQYGIYSTGEPYQRNGSFFVDHFALFLPSAEPGKSIGYRIHGAVNSSPAPLGLYQMPLRDVLRFCWSKSLSCARIPIRQSKLSIMETERFCAPSSLPFSFPLIFVSSYSSLCIWSFDLMAPNT